MLVSAVQCESALCIHIFLPLEPPSHPSRSSQTEHWAELPLLDSSFPLALCIIHGSVSMPVFLSQLAPSSPHSGLLNRLYFRRRWSVLCVLAQVDYDGIQQFHISYVVTKHSSDTGALGWHHTWFAFLLIWSPYHELDSAKRCVLLPVCAHLPEKEKCKYLLLEPQQIFWKRYRDADSKNEFFFSGDESRFCYCLDESKDEVYGDIGNWNRQNIMSSTLLQIEYRSLFFMVFFIYCSFVHLAYWDHRHFFFPGQRSSL